MSKKAYPSFSLIEMIVVLAITALIAGMVFANMRAGGGVTDLNSNAEKLAAIIKQAQINTLSGKHTLGSRPDGGYGVYVTNSFPSGEYRLFADTNNISDHCYNPNPGGDTDIQTFNLSNHIVLDSAVDYYIIFIPPKGAIYVGTTCTGAPSSNATPLSGTTTSLIVLKHTEETRYAHVEVNAQGQIDVRKVAP